MTSTENSSAEAAPVVERDDRDRASRQARVSEKTGSALKPPAGSIPAPARASASRAAATAAGAPVVGGETTLPPLLGTKVADAYRKRLRETLAGFVDSPADAAAGADVLLQEAIDQLADALAKRREELSRERQASAGDTERLRQSLLRYRKVLESVVTL